MMQEIVSEIVYHSKGNIKLGFTLFDRIYKNSNGTFNQEFLKQEIDFFEELRNIRIANKEKEVLRLILWIMRFISYIAIRTVIFTKVQTPN